MSIVLNINKVSDATKRLAALAAAATSEVQLTAMLAEQDDLKDFAVTWCGRFNQYALKKESLAEKKGLFVQNDYGAYTFRRPTVFINGKGRLVIIRLGPPKEYQTQVDEAKQIIANCEDHSSIIAHLIDAKFAYFSIKECSAEKAQEAQLRIKPNGKYVETFQNKAGGWIQISLDPNVII